MQKLLTLIICSVISTVTIQSQNSYIINADFESTDWQNTAWFSQTNTGSPIIVSQTEPFFIKDGIVAHSGLHFAYIGGVQSPAGLYEAEIVQEFYLPTAGQGKMDFYVQYINGSVDPGSKISISIDGNEVWSINPHYIINTVENYEMIQVQLGFLEAGNHTIALHGYENPLGGNVPMKFAFDDFILTSVASSSINEEENIGLSIVCNPHMIQIQTTTSLNEEANIQLVDLSGKVVATSITYFQNACSLAVNPLNDGIYILSIKTATQSFSRKLFIQH